MRIVQAQLDTLQQIVNIVNKIKPPVKLPWEPGAPLVGWLTYNTGPANYKCGKIQSAELIVTKISVIRA